MTEVSDWRSWLRHQKPVLLKHTPRQYEFARRVLTRVPGLAPSEVKPEHPFTDSKGNQRFMDFTIVRGRTRLAIEVDGWDKTGTNSGSTPTEHRDSLMRERSLVAQGWLVLRIPNSELYSDAENNAQAVEIKAVLEREPTSSENPDAQRVVVEVVQVPAPHQPPLLHPQRSPRRRTRQGYAEGPHGQRLPVLSLPPSSLSLCSSL